MADLYGICSLAVGSLINAANTIDCYLVVFYLLFLPYFTWLCSVLGCCLSDIIIIIIIIQHLYSAIVSYAGCRGDRKGIELVKTGHSIALVFF